MVVMLALAACGGGHLDAAHAGIVIDYSQGSNSNHYTLVEPGEYYATGINQALFEYPIGQESLVMIREQTNGAKGDDSVQCADQNGIPMHVDTTVLWRVDPKQIIQLYQRRPQMPLISDGSVNNGVVNQNDVEDQVVQPLTRRAVVDACAKFAWDKINAQRDQFNTDVQTELTGLLHQEYLLLDQLALRNIYFEQQQVDQINQIQAAQAKAQAAAYAQQEAQNQAAASQIQTAQDAKNIATIQDALTKSPEYIRYLEVQKWDGHLPQVVSGSGTQGTGTDILVPVPTPTGN